MTHKWDIYYQAKQRTSATSAGKKECGYSSSSFQLCVTSGWDVWYADWDGSQFPFSTDIQTTHTSLLLQDQDQLQQTSLRLQQRILLFTPKLHLISQQPGQRRQDKHGDFTPSAHEYFGIVSSLSHTSELAWQMINAPHSRCTSTPALIKLRWSVRGQVGGILHPSSEFQEDSPPSRCEVTRVCSDWHFLTITACTAINNHASP